jgi:hypothetical protein
VTLIAQYCGKHHDFLQLRSYPGLASPALGTGLVPSLNSIGTELDRHLNMSVTELWPPPGGPES